MMLNVTVAQVTHRFVGIQLCACGECYGRDAWCELDVVGYQEDACGGLLELRSCSWCGSTLSCECEADEGDTVLPPPAAAGFDALGVMPTEAEPVVGWPLSMLDNSAEMGRS